VYALCVTAFFELNPFVFQELAEVSVKFVFFNLFHKPLTFVLGEFLIFVIPAIIDALLNYNLLQVSGFIFPAPDCNFWRG
jgi:hypothetical protein